MLNKSNAAITVHGVVIFASLFVVMTEFPVLLAAEYGFTADIIGVCFLPTGVGLMLGSIVGGKAADICARWYIAQESRMILGTVGTFVTPIGLLMVGLGFAFKLHLIMPLIGSFLVGIGQGGYLPAVQSYFSSKYQQEAAAVLAAVLGLDFCMSGVVVIIVEALVEALGVVGIFALIAGLCVLTTIITGVFLYVSTKAA